MAAHLKDVERDDLRTLFKLKVKPEQEDQVSPNAATIAQAAYEPGAKVWGLWDLDVPVGLLAMIDLEQNPDRDPDAPNAAYIWRLMIASDHQSKGYGRDALAGALQITHDWGRSDLLLSAVEKENGALPFYQRFGFERTGKLVYGEVEMRVSAALLSERLAAART